MSRERLTRNENRVMEYLKTHHLPTSAELSEKLKLPLSTVYRALNGIGAERQKTGKRQFGYFLPNLPIPEKTDNEKALDLLNEAQACINMARHMLSGSAMGGFLKLE